MISKKDLRIDQNVLWKSFGFIVRILYFPFGLLLALVTIFQIAALFVTIVGIPVAIVLAKSLGTYFNPVHKICVSQTLKNALEQREAKEAIG